MAETLPEITVRPEGVPPPPPGFAPVGSNTITPPPAGFEPVSAAPTAQAEAPPPPRGFIAQALSPITNLPSTYAKNVREATHMMGEGVEQLGTEGQRLSGIANVGLGALKYGFSPIESAVESLAGQPIENVTGLPKEYTDFTIGLALPGVGFAKMPGVAKSFPLPLRQAEKILSPETVSPLAEDAAALIRGGTGPAARATETTAAQLEPFYATANRLPQPDQWNLQNYIDGGRSASTPSTPALRALADTLKASFKERKAQLQALPQFQLREFLEDFFPHMWQDPGAARQFATSWGIGKQGSGASLKGRTMPTFEDGIAAGLRPLYDNPIDAAMRYFMSMDKFIAATKVLNEAEVSGIAIRVNPTVMGASGRPGSLAGVPPGYVELAGRGAKGVFAPENFARVYNNWLSEGFERFPTGGGVYEAARKFNNGMTQALLGFSGYHAATMAEAAMGTDTARAIAAVRRMDWKDTLKAIGHYPVAAVQYAREGGKYKDIYLGKAAQVSAEDREIVDLLTQAGGRMAGTRHAYDLDASALGDYFTAWRRAQLKNQVAAQFANARQNPITGTAGMALSNLARVIETVNKPLFQHYIPSMKNGVQAQLMSDWLKANPGAGATEKIAQARKIVDTVDDRFGEMIQDNIFWNKMFKQTAQLAMLSYSWNVGGWRAIGGGMRDIARTTVGQQAWTPKADYVVATAINWAAISAMYQYMKTGEKPQDLHDLVAPRTGGTDSRSGQPERIIVPGIMKDVFGYFEHPVQEAGNKLNPGLQLAGDVLMNRDWRGDPVFAPKQHEQNNWQASGMWLGNLFDVVQKRGMPITFQNIGKQEEGSALNTPERLMGVRTAPRYLTDPEGAEAMRDRIRNRLWYGKRGRGGKLFHDEQERQRYQPLP